MKTRLFLILAILLATGGSLHAQGGYYRDIAYKKFNGAIMVAPGASITICSSAGVGAPCTPKSTLFSNVGLTVSLANPVIADANGTFSFYATPGFYTYTINGPGLTPAGPFT